MSWIFYLMPNKHKRISLENLNLVFPELTSKELNKLLGIEEEVKSPSNNNEQEKASNWSPITPETTTAFSEIED